MSLEIPASGQAGSRHQEPVLRFDDPVTGRPCLRLTDPATHCHHPYFYYRCFTPDGERVLYISSRSGRPQAYLLETSSGESVQLTEAAEIGEYAIWLSRDGRHLLYSDNNRLHRLCLDDLKSEVIYEQTAPYASPNGTISIGLSDDERLALICQIHSQDRVTGKGWSHFEPQWRKRPRCRLLLLNMETGEQRVVLEEELWLGHPQIRPGDPDTLMFCHEGPVPFGEAGEARIWTMRADGSQVRPLVHVKTTDAAGEPNVIVTHECFLPDGSGVLYIHFPRTYGLDGSLRIYDLERQEEVNLGPVSNYSHPSPSPDGRFIAGDEANNEHRAENMIWLFDVEKRREQPVCLHGSSFEPRGSSTQDAHPHPAFSPDGRRILFTSDRETGPQGNCISYLAEI